MRSALRFFIIAIIFGCMSPAIASDPSYVVSAVPDPNSIYIEQVTVNGSGCPAGTVAANFTPDYSMLELTFSSFVAQIGPGTMPSDWRKNCIVAVTLHIPAGFTFALIGANYRGYAQLDPGVTGRQQTTYFIAGMLGANTMRTDVPKELDAYGNYERNDEIPVENWVWAKCGVDSIANLNASVSLNNSKAPKSYGLMTLDETDIGSQVLFQWHLAWQKC
jgi:hypothetical protein